MDENPKIDVSPEAVIPVRFIQALAKAQSQLRKKPGRPLRMHSFTTPQEVPGSENNGLVIPLGLLPGMDAAQSATCFDASLGRAFGKKRPVPASWTSQNLYAAGIILSSEENGMPAPHLALGRVVSSNETLLLLRSFLGEQQVRGDPEHKTQIATELRNIDFQLGQRFDSVPLVWKATNGGIFTVHNPGTGELHLVDFDLSQVKRDGDGSVSGLNEEFGGQVRGTMG